MKIIQELGLNEFKAWSGAVATKEIIINNDMVEEFNSLIDELYPEGLTDTELNDILWFEDQWIFESLGINEEDEEEEEDEE